jgi:hypothetical protein
MQVDKPRWQGFGDGTHHYPNASEYLDKMPIYLTDFKRENYGVSVSKPPRKGKPGTRWLVCHDYGTSLMLEHGMYTTKTQKADWWNA